MTSGYFKTFSRFIRQKKGEPEATDAAETQPAGIRTSHENGHFYSPVVDPTDISEREESIWPEDPEILGIDFDDASHKSILELEFPRHYPKYDYPEHLEESPELKSFFTQNSQFSWLDSRALFVLLQV